MRKGSKLYSISRFKCPECHEGDFFVDNNPYHLSKIGDIQEKCSNCGCKYSKEPGFYYGAMYVAYGLGVALFVACWVGTSILWPEYTTAFLISLIFGASIILGPVLYVLSKIIWANLFLSYKGNPRREKA